MAKIHGRGVALSIDGDDLGAAVSGGKYTTSVTFARTAETHDVTTHGHNSKVYASGLKDSTATLEGVYDSTAATGPGAILRPLVGGNAVELVYEPEGTGVGKPLATVDVIVNSYEESAPVNDMITWTAECQGSGDIVDTVGA